MLEFVNISFGKKSLSKLFAEGCFYCEVKYWSHLHFPDKKKKEPEDC